MLEDAEAWTTPGDGFDAAGCYSSETAGQQSARVLSGPWDGGAYKMRPE